MKDTIYILYTMHLKCACFSSTKACKQCTFYVHSVFFGSCIFFATFTITVTSTSTHTVLTEIFNFTLTDNCCKCYITLLSFGHLACPNLLFQEMEKTVFNPLKSTMLSKLTSTLKYFVLVTYLRKPVKNKGWMAKNIYHEIWRYKVVKGQQRYTVFSNMSAITSKLPLPVKMTNHKMW